MRSTALRGLTLALLIAAVSTGASAQTFEEQVAEMVNQNGEIVDGVFVGNSVASA